MAYETKIHEGPCGRCEETFTGTYVTKRPKYCSEECRHPTKRGGKPYVQVPELVDRNQKITDAYLGGLGMKEVGEQFGITRAMVSLIIRANGVDGWEVNQARQAARAADTKQQKVQERWAGRRCRICDKPITANVVGRRAVTCGGECADAWVALRFHLDPTRRDRHRIGVARWTVAHPDRFTQNEVERSQRVIDGTAPPTSRHFVVEGSRAEFYARKFGFTELLAYRDDGWEGRASDRQRSRMQERAHQRRARHNRRVTARRKGR